MCIRYIFELVESYLQSKILLDLCYKQSMGLCVEHDDGCAFFLYLHADDEI